MSKAMSAYQFKQQLKKWGVDFEPYQDSWESHNRNHKGEWGDMHGVMLHHTGPFSSNNSMLSLLWTGYNTLPGPLCHGGLDTNGKVWGIGWGRANHAGLGDDEVLRSVIREGYSKTPWKGDRLEANTDGNSVFYGLEVIHSGNHYIDRDQYVPMILFAAAICDWHGWTEKSVIGHGEWQPGKWDPGHRSGEMMNMAAVRFDIAQALEKGPGNWPEKPKPEPEPEKPSGDYYIVKDNDTLWSIAEKLYGDGSLWPELVGANPKIFPLPVGAKLKIPE